MTFEEICVVEAWVVNYSFTATRLHTGG